MVQPFESERSERQGPEEAEDKEGQRNWVRERQDCWEGSQGTESQRLWEARL